GTGAPLLFDDDYNAKPCYYAVQDELANAPPVTPTPVPTAAPTPTQTDPLRGDVDGDGTIDIIDALVVAQYSVNLDPSPFIPGNADVDCNGNIDIVDALLIAQYYVDLISGFCN
ncbi:MAG: hypothetical protein JXJ04_05070, partial [Spirochaetales bacterium]|nr:hypothetical protein [Spirochaetales bacterium]